MEKVHEIEGLLQILQAGGTIAYPTDTIRGIGCDATNAHAVDKIYEIKQRPKEKSLIVLFASEEMLQEYGVTLSDEQKILLANSEKPTTIIVNGVLGLAPNVYHSDGSLGVRIVNPREGHPGSAWCNKLIQMHRKPLVSTSANLSGEPTPVVFDDIPSVIADMLDGYPDRNTSLTAGEPSQIIRIDTDGKVTILRA